MEYIVLVHGGGTGGWQWREVAAHLRRAGHEVFTPTLTGMGERAHLAHPGVDLTTHMRDVLNVLIYEQLGEVILLGHSYAGMVITAVAEQAPKRIAQLIYLDALVPRDGQSAAAIAGPEFMRGVDEVVAAQGEGWYIPSSGEPRMSIHPIKSIKQPLTLSNPAAAALPRTYIACTQNHPDWPFTPVLARQAAQARADGWRYYELPTHHFAHDTMPGELAAIICEVVDAGNRAVG